MMTRSLAMLLVGHPSFPSQLPQQGYTMIMVDKNALFVGLWDCEEVTTFAPRNERIIITLKKYHQIISIGGGTAIDIGKYLSYKFNIKLIILCKNINLLKILKIE